jgi:hypothetical protein
MVPELYRKSLLTVVLICRKRYFNSVCPGYRQRVYTLKTEENSNGELDLQKNGQGRIHQLQVMLAGSDANCIRIEGSVFDDT